MFKKLFLGVITVSVIATFVWIVSPTNTDVDFITTTITINEYVTAYDKNLLINEVGLKMNVYNEGEMEGTMTEVYGYELRVDNNNPRFIYSAGKFDDTVSGLSVRVPDGPWMKYGKCTLAYLDQGCRYGVKDNITNSGLIYAVVNSDEGNVYKDDKASGFYVFVNQKWYTITNNLYWPEEHPGYVRGVFGENAFVKSDGCTTYFTTKTDTNELEYNTLDVCNFFDVPKQPVDTREGILIDGVEIFARTLNTYEQAPLDSEFLFGMATTPVPCSKIPSSALSLFTIDYGDGTVTPAKCDLNSDGHTYFKADTYTIRLRYDERVVYSKEIVVDGR